MPPTVNDVVASFLISQQLVAQLSLFFQNAFVIPGISAMQQTIFANVFLVTYLIARNF